MLIKKTVRIGVLICTAIVVFALLMFGQGCAKKAPQAKLEKAPDFTLKDLSGKPVTLSEYTKAGNVVVVDFWASWCTNCQEAAPELVKLQAGYKGKPVKMIGVAIDQDIAAVKAFAKQKHLNYTICHDPNVEKLGKLYSVVGIPVTYIIDRDGYIRYSHSGLPADAEGQKREINKLKQEVDSLLKS